MEADVLIEGESKKNPDVLSGYTPKNKLVNFAGPQTLIGMLVKVRITKTKTWSLNGELMEVVSDQEVGVYK